MVNPVTSPGVLYIVATPIGNLEDITLRAIKTLQTVDYIAAEDTRHSQQLLNYYQIKTPMISLHEHNELQRAASLLERLRQGQNIALIADAGTPLISDPGYHLVTVMHESGIRVIPIPGACAAIAGLVASGLPTDRFVFEGFLPHKSALRKKKLLGLAHETRTIIFYESVHRIVDFIDLLVEIFGPDRRATIARELTKTYESIHQDTVIGLKKWAADFPKKIKGEFVVIVKGSVIEKNNTFKMFEHRSLLQALLKHMPLKQAVDIACETTGASRKIIYAMALAEKNENKTKPNE